MKNFTLLVLLIISLSNCSPRQKSPEELRAELEMQEKINPLHYLNVDAKLSVNRVVTRTRLFGNNETEQRGWKVGYTIKNDASVATYKDVQVRIDFISKTETVIDSRVITKYEFLKPGQSLSFNEIIQGPTADLVNTFNASIQSAVAAN